ncbi:MAG: corrinoid protein [Eubacteriales bacterium]|nr:corrinoid protein [Eubacteriales bacterium]
MSEKQALLNKLSDEVFEMEDEAIQETAKEYLAHGYPALDAIIHGLVDGMDRASKMFEEEEYFVADLLLCSDAMYAALDILKPWLSEEEEKTKIKAVIGAVEGDTHDIGKNLVKILMETAGFEMIDLGRDVPLRRFIDAAVEENASLICMSTLMTTTMTGMEEVIRMLCQEGLRERFKVMIGGGPISQRYADKIGADGYSANAVEAVKLAKRLVGVN